MTSDSQAVGKIVYNSKLITSLEHAKLYARLENTKLIGRLMRERAADNSLIQPRRHAAQAAPHPAPAPLREVEEMRMLEGLRNKSSLYEPQSYENRSSGVPSVPLRSMEATQASHTLGAKGQCVDRLL